MTVRAFSPRLVPFLHSLARLSPGGPSFVGVQHFGTHASPGPHSRSRRPAAVAAGHFGLAVLAIAVSSALRLPWRAGVSIAVASAVLGIVQIARGRLELGRQRRAADSLLRTGARVHPASELLLWRAAELTSDRNRKVLSGSLSRIVCEVTRPSLNSAVPLDRRGVWPHIELLTMLARRLAALERPVAAQGMVLVEDLLTDGFSSPLYIGGHSGDLPAVVERCLHALDGHVFPSLSIKECSDSADDLIDVNCSTNLASGGSH
jgi:hypothetical protein